MGRLTKRMIDQVIAHRREGYTQTETAEILGLNLKTVRKYDPLRKGSVEETIPGRLSLPVRVDLIENLVYQLGVQLWHHFTFDESELPLFVCPYCEGQIPLAVVTAETAQGERLITFACRQCNFYLDSRPPIIPDRIRWDEDLGP